MESKIFLSCGQNESEMSVARQIEQTLAAAPYGFEVYVAKNVQSLFEINSDIVRELKDSDYYLFVNFRRGKRRFWKREVPGSVFANQEFAIAYALGFERILVVNQRSVSQEGMLRYFGCNTDRFNNHTDCLTTVIHAWDRTGWKSNYSRRLWPGKTRVSGYINYGSGHIQLQGQMLYLDIHNGRPDAALEATARLVRYRAIGSATWTQSHILSVLKTYGKPAFSQTIFPQSYGAFDLLCIGTSPTAIQSERATQHVYLNSAFDYVPTPFLQITNGTWELEYQFCAIGFPLLTVVVELTWPMGGQPSARVLQ